MGEKIEIQYEKMKIEELEQALLKKEQEVRKEMEELLVQEVDKVRAEMENIYRNRLQYVKQQLILSFQEKIKERDIVLCKKADQKVYDSLSYLRKSMAEEMELIATTRMAENEELNRFHRIWDANKANEVFKKKVNNLKKKWMKILKKAKKISVKEKREIKKKFMEFHNEEIQKLKEACDKEFTESLQTRTVNYRRTISTLLKEIKKKEEEYKKLKIEKECAHVEQYSWCYLVRELLKQFQKFINYALQKEPGHAEYMISLEKILQVRIKSLTEAELLGKYIDEKGSHLIEEMIKEEDEKLKMQPRDEVVEEEKTRKEYPCLPEDIFRKKEEQKKQIRTKDTVTEIKAILDKVVGRATPRMLTELPCIESELWSSVKSEPCVAPVPAPKPGGLRVAGEDLGPESGPAKDFAMNRVRSLVRVLNRHPAIKLAILGNS